MEERKRNEIIVDGKKIKIPMPEKQVEGVRKKKPPLWVLIFLLSLPIGWCILLAFMSRKEDMTWSMALIMATYLVFAFLSASRILVKWWNWKPFTEWEHDLPASYNYSWENSSLSSDTTSYKSSSWDEDFSSHHNKSSWGDDFGYKPGDIVTNPAYSCFSGNIWRSDD